MAVAAASRPLATGLGMDDSVRRAMARWPQVPAVYGWLALDRCGRWWLKGELIERRALREFIGRNYACDRRGAWYFQNGPQRGYVRLEYTPWVVFTDGGGNLVDHTGAPVAGLRRAVVDESGDVVVAFDRGAGLLHGDALHWFSERLERGDGTPMTAAEQERAIGRLMAGDAADLALRVGIGRVAVEGLARARVPKRFDFDPKPRAGTESSG